MNAKLQKDEQDRVRIIDGLKSIEAVKKRVDEVEEKQTAQEEEVSDQRKILEEQSRKLTDLEERQTQTVDVNEIVNKAAMEMAERERRSRNFLVHLLPESLFTDQDDAMNDDKQKIEKLIAKITPKPQINRLFRLGQPRTTDQKPRSILVIAAESNQAKAVVNASFARTLDKIQGAPDIHCTKDRSLNQRIVAGKINPSAETGGETSRGRGRGRGYGHGRGRGRRSRGGRVTPSQSDRSDSRKRSRVDEESDVEPRTKKTRDPPHQGEPVVMPIHETGSDIAREAESDDRGASGGGAGGSGAGGNGPGGSGADGRERETQVIASVVSPEEVAINEAPSSTGEIEGPISSLPKN